MISKDLLIKQITDEACTKLLGNGAYNCGTIYNTEKPTLEIYLNSRLSNIATYITSTFSYKSRALDDSLSEEEKDVNKKAVDMIDGLVQNEIARLNIEAQKQQCSANHDIFSTHTYLEFPITVEGLNNSCDCSAMLLYYNSLDTIWNNKARAIDYFACRTEDVFNKVTELLQVSISRKEAGKASIADIEKIIGEKDILTTLYELPTKEEQLEFVKANVEFTHVNICHTYNAEGGMVTLFGDIEESVLQSGSVISYETFVQYPALFEAWSNENFYSEQFKKDVSACEMVDTIVLFENNKDKKAYESSKTLPFIPFGEEHLVGDYTKEIELRAINENKNLVVMGSNCVFDQRICPSEIEQEVKDADTYGIYKDNHSVRVLYNQADMGSVDNISYEVDKAKRKCTELRKHLIHKAYIKNKCRELKDKYNKVVANI